MTQRLSVTKAVLLCSLSLAIASCGPSFEEQQQTREAERLASSEQALVTFAESHGATPVEIWSDSFGLRRSFTAQLQDELEGSVVAFRGSLLDIVRTSTGAGGDYEVAFGDPFFGFGGTLFTLSTSERDAAKLRPHSRPTARSRLRQAAPCTESRDTAILAVVDQLITRRPGVERLLQRIEGEIAAERAGHAPSHDAAREDIDDEGDVGKATPGRHVRQIRDLVLSKNPIDAVRRADSTLDARGSRRS